MESWNRLWGCGLWAPSLETHKIRLDVELGSLIQLEVTLLAEEGLDKMAFGDLFQPDAVCECEITGL